MVDRTFTFPSDGQQSTW